MDLNGLSRSTPSQRDRVRRRILALSAVTGAAALGGAGALTIGLASSSSSTVAATSVTPVTATTTTTGKTTPSSLASTAGTSSSSSNSTTPVATSGGS